MITNSLLILICHSNLYSVYLCEIKLLLSLFCEDLFGTRFPPSVERPDSQCQTAAIGRNELEVWQAFCKSGSGVKAHPRVLRLSGLFALVFKEAGLL